MLRPVKTHSIPLPPMAPLMACSLKDDVENTLFPYKNRAGRRMKGTRNALKNVMTKGCMLPLKNFTDACMMVIEMPPIIIKMIAFSIALFLELSDKNAIFHSIMRMITLTEINLFNVPNILSDTKVPRTLAGAKTA
jgi:hypothetical protein|tara:strand:- start:4354 stop:4761 length:408 start_codon:yes stop_codon:yes gene_type:complete